MMLARFLRQPLPLWAVVLLCMIFSGMVASAATAQYAAQLFAITPNSSSVPLTVTGVASQSANLSTWRNSALTTIASVSATGAMAGTGVSSSTTVTGATGVVASNGQFVAPAATAFKACANNTCTGMPSVATSGGILYPFGASSGAQAFLCTTPSGALNVCTWTISSATISSGTCASGQWCQNVLVGTFASTGSFGCIPSYVYHSGGVGNGISLTSLTDLVTSQIYISVSNLTGSSINFATNPVTISYACPYFGG